MVSGMSGPARLSLSSHPPLSTEACGWSLGCNPGQEVTTGAEDECVCEREIVERFISGEVTNFEKENGYNMYCNILFIRW